MLLFSQNAIFRIRLSLQEASHAQKSKVQICTLNSTAANYAPCPANYSCLSAFGDRPRILTSAGVEESYCCPPVPNVIFSTQGPFAMKNKLFESVCFYGDPARVADPDMGCPPGYYYFLGIGVGPSCCPEPCTPHPVAQAVVINGKCTYSYF